MAQGVTAKLQRELLPLVDRVRSGDEKAFEEVWTRTKGLVFQIRFFDPTGILDKGDFESVAMRGLHGAFFHKGGWKQEKGQLVAYLVKCMRNAVLSELGRVKKYKVEVPMDGLGREECKEFFQKDESWFQPVSSETAEQVYYFYTQKVYQELLETDEKAALAFKLKEENPKIRKVRIAKILGVTTTEVSCLFRDKIRRVISQVLTEVWGEGIEVILPKGKSGWNLKIAGTS